MGKGEREAGECDKRLRNFMAILFTLSIYCQQSAKSQSPNCLTCSLKHGLAPNKPTRSLLDYGECATQVRYVFFRIQKLKETSVKEPQPTKGQPVAEKILDSQALLIATQQAKGERDYNDEALALLNELKLLMNLWRSLMSTFGTEFKPLKTAINRSNTTLQVDRMKVNTLNHQTIRQANIIYHNCFKM